ncbi:hypothetical protein ACTGU6_10895, partial [Streptococcus suis]
AVQFVLVHDFGPFAGDGKTGRCVNAAPSIITVMIRSGVGVWRRRAKARAQRRLVRATRLSRSCIG